jgi:hypothetical protein
VHGNSPGSLPARDGRARDGTDDAADNRRVRPAYRMTDDCAGTRAEHCAGKRVAGHGRAAQAERRNTDQTAGEQRAPGCRYSSGDLGHDDSGTASAPMSHLTQEPANRIAGRMKKL